MATGDVCLIYFAITKSGKPGDDAEMNNYAISVS